MSVAVLSSRVTFLLTKGVATGVLALTVATVSISMMEMRRRKP